MEKFESITVKELMEQETPRGDGLSASYEVPEHLIMTQEEFTRMLFPRPIAERIGRQLKQKR